MIQFTAAVTLSSNTNVTKVTLYSGTTGTTKIKDITDFRGAVLDDDAGIGEYIVVALEDTSSDAYTVTKIQLSGTVSGSETVIANSELVSVAKTASQSLQLRFTAQFANASYCRFANTIINLPYATNYRDGIIRLARSTGETQKSKTVYSAADVETLIAAGIGDSDKFVPWDLNNNQPVEGDATVAKLTVVDDYDNAQCSATLTCSEDSNTGDVYLNTNSLIGGSAVTSTPAITVSGTITGSPLLVTEDYISSLYSNSVTEGSGSSITATDKLVSGEAVATYVSDQITASSASYVHIAGAETVTGAKTFSAATTFTDSVIISGTNKKLTTPEVTSGKYNGDGVYATYVAGTGSTGWGNSNNSAKITTVAAVTGAIGASESAITQAYQNADSSLQSQIDALNAGQNLADIVATKSALDSLSITNLQAGDKVQVLADETHDGASTVYNLSSTSPKTWTYIGKYGQDSYNKSEADTLFVENSQIKQSVDSTKQDEIPSSAAVATYVSTQISSAGGAYVKLTSQTTQNITSALDITGQVDIDNVTISGSNITSSYVNTSGGSYSYRLYTVPIDSSYSEFCISQRKGSSDIAEITFDGENKFMSFYNGHGTLCLKSVSDGNDGYSPDVYGTHVASYRAITGATLSDGRLVTVDYLTAFTGDMSDYVKKSSQTAQTITSDLDITGDVDVTGSLTIDDLRLDGSTIISYNTGCGGQSYRLNITNDGYSAGFDYMLTDDNNTSGVGSLGTVASLAFSADLPGSPAYTELYVRDYSITFTSEGTGANKKPVVSGSFVADYSTAGLSSVTDGRLATVDYVGSLIGSSTTSLHSAASDGTSQVGAIGLFMYTEVGAEKAIGATVSGQYLYPVGMTLPNSGQIAYKKSATSMASGTTWTLMSLAMKRTATEPCLVLAMRTA